MNSIFEEQQVIDNEEAFVIHTRLWDDEHEDCEVGKALQQYDVGNFNILELLNVVDNVDDEWRESFEYFLKRG